MELEVMEPKDRSGALSLELVYPFGANKAMIDDAPNGFVEAMGLISLASSRSHDDPKGSADNMVLAQIDTSFSFDDKLQDPSGEGCSHVHSLRIFGEDYDWLQPGLFLNDTHIDFWQWYALCIVVVNHYVVYHIH